MTGRIELAELDTCVVSDALDRLGLTGVVSRIHQMWDGGRIAGPVRTVGLRRLEPGEQPVPGIHLGARTIASCERGDVIVVAHQGRADSAGWGGLLCNAAAQAGARAVVVDGACRDVDDAVELGFPLFATGATPATARGRTVEESYNQPVRIGDITVSPGDVVVADRSGVVFIAREHFDRVLGVAGKLVATERRMLAALRNGSPATDVLGRDYDAMVTEQPAVEGGVGRP